MKIPKTESKTVEFKKTFNQEAIESLVAFANTDGGSVYVGVRDDGKVLGVQLANESETTWINEIKLESLGINYDAIGLESAGLKQCRGDIIFCKRKITGIGRLAILDKRELAKDTHRVVRTIGIHALRERRDLL